MFKFLEKLNCLNDLSLFVIRATLAYGFFEPARQKLMNLDNTASWFGEGLGLPLPYLNAVMAGVTEGLGVILLATGFLTRLISLPLMVVMVVAITMVHWEAGYTGPNGFIIPYLYMIMLFQLATNGAGKYSIDYLVSNRD